MSARSALAIAILLAFGSAAHAEKVDWGPYLEKPGTKFAYKSTKPAADSAPRAKQTVAKQKKKGKQKPASKARRKVR
jgi:hypothetical protein